MERKRTCVVVVKLWSQASGDKHRIQEGVDQTRGRRGKGGDRSASVCWDAPFLKLVVSSQAFILLLFSVPHYGRDYWLFPNVLSSPSSHVLLGQVASQNIDFSSQWLLKLEVIMWPSSDQWDGSGSGGSDILQGMACALLSPFLWAHGIESSSCHLGPWHNLEDGKMHDGRIKHIWAMPSMESLISQMSYLQSRARREK